MVRSDSKKIRDAVIFAMLAAVMFASKVIMEVLPNIHLLGTLTMAYTVAFRKKALIPIYLYVMINGVYSGFAFWWIPYLYVWAVLWGVTMLIPRRLPVKVKCVLYPLVCSLHGFAFGILYAPAQALIYGYNFEQAVAWVVAGFPFDIIHGISNLAAGTLIFSLSELLIKLYNSKVK